MNTDILIGALLGSLISAWIACVSHRYFEFARVKQDLALRFLQFHRDFPTELLESPSPRHYQVLFRTWAEAEFELARFHLEAIGQYGPAAEAESIQRELLAFIDRQTERLTGQRPRASALLDPNSVLVLHAQTMNHLRREEGCYLTRIRGMNPDWLPLLAPFTRLLRTFPRLQRPAAGDSQRPSVPPPAHPSGTPTEDVAPAMRNR